MFFIYETVRIGCRITNPDGTPATGKSVGCTVYDPDGVKVVNDQSCSEIGEGDYDYPVGFSDCSGVWQINFDCDDPVFHDGKSVMVYGIEQSDYIIADASEQQIMHRNESEPGTYEGAIDLGNMTEGSKVTLRYYEDVEYDGERPTDTMIVLPEDVITDKVVRFKNIKNTYGFKLTLQQEKYPILGELDSIVRYDPIRGQPYMVHSGAYLYVGASYTTKLVKITHATMVVHSEITLPGYCYGNPVVDGTDMYVPVYDDYAEVTKLSKVNLTDFSGGITTLTIGWWGQPRYMILAGDGYIYMATDSGYLLRINITTLGVQTTATLSNIVGLADDGTYLYVQLSTGNLYRYLLSGNLSEDDGSVNIGVSGLSGLAYDGSDYLYVLHNASPGGIYKVDVSSWEVVDDMLLDDNYPNLCMIYSGYLYSTVYDSSNYRRVTRVDLSTFLEDDDTTVAYDPNDTISSFANDGDDIVYVGIGVDDDGEPARIVAMDLTSWPDYGTAIKLPSMVYPLRITTDGTYIYWICDSRVYRTDIATMGAPAVVDTETTGTLSAIVYDSETAKLYVGTKDRPDYTAKIFRIDVAGFEVDNDITLAYTAARNISSLCVSNGMLYASHGYGTSAVTQIDLSTFLEEDYLTTAPYQGAYKIIAYDGNLYVGSQGVILVIDENTFTRIDVVDLFSTPYSVVDLMYYDGVIYATQDTSGLTKLYEIDPVTVVATRVITIPGYSEETEGLVIYDDDLYVFTSDYSGTIVSIVNKTTMAVDVSCSLLGAYYTDFVTSGSGLYAIIYDGEGGIVSFEPRGGDEFQYYITRKGE